jgi:predicted acetyltransferase
MAVEVRHPADLDELRAGMTAGSIAFGDELKDDEFDRQTKTMRLDRFLTAYDGGRPVGSTGAYPFRLTVPGGELAAGGVTWVGVIPSHRRRGALTQMMRTQLDELHELGEPLAILWASEAAIYGRFGYGVAVPETVLDTERARFGWRADPGPEGAVRIVDRDEALEIFPSLYERVRREVPGFVTRDRNWWEHYKLADPESWRRGYGPKFFALLELEGEAAGFAMYRIKQGWEQGYATSELRVGDAFATSVRATRELWRFLFGIDLIKRVHARVDPALPLFLMVRDPRNAQLRLSEGVWLRLVDVEAALRGRSYAADEHVVAQVRDEFCPWNDGRWRLGPDAGRTDDEPELELDVADLASVYMGAFDFRALAAAERVSELKPGALDRASALFRTERPPYCPEDF